MSNLKDKYNNRFDDGAETKAPSSSKLLEKYDAYKTSSYKPKSITQTQKPEQTLYTTKSGRNITMSTLENWANPRYKAGEDEVKEIKEFLNGTRRMNPKKGVNGLDLETTANIDALRPNISRQLPSVSAISSFGTGLTEGLLPFLDIEKHDAKVAAKEAKRNSQNGNYYYNNNEAQWVNRNADENKLANIGGRLGGSMVLYKGASSIPAVGKIAEGATKALGGTKVAGYLGNLIADTSVDLGLDTLPQIVRDIRDDKNGKDVAIGAAENLAANIGFNIGGDALGRLIGKVLDGKNAQNVVDAIKKDAKPEVPTKVAPTPEMLEAQAKRIAEEQKALTPDSLSNYQKEIDAAREAQRAEEAMSRRLLEEQNAQPSDLNSLMEQFNKSQNTNNALDGRADLPVSTPKQAQTTIPTLAENKPLKTASSVSIKKTSYDTKKVSDRTLDRVMNDHFNMFGKSIPEVRAELKAAINEYEQTFSKESLDRVRELTAQAERQMTGGIYNRVKDAGKRSGNARPISYPNSRGTITDNVMGYIDSITAKHAITNSGASYDDDMKALSDLISKDSAEAETLWASLSSLKQSLDSFVKTGDEANLDKAIEDMTTFVRESDIPYSKIQLPFETSIKKAVEAFQNNSARNIAENTGLNGISRRIAEEQTANVTQAIPEAVQSTAKSVSYVPERTVEEVASQGAQRASKYASDTLINKTDMDDGIKEAFADNPVIYNQLSNADTSLKATQIMESGNLNNAYKQYKDLLASKNAVAVPLGYDIAKQMVAEGNHDGALDILEELSRELTRSGQFSQAAAIRLVKEDPMAALRLMQRQVKKINDYGAKKFKNWTDFKLTDDEVKAFGDLKKGDEEAINNLFDSITMRMANEMPSTTWEKIVEATKLAMMFNPRTHIRNVAANTILAPIRSLSDRVSAIGQNIAHLINPDVQVTQSLVGGTKEQKNLARQIFDEKILPLLKNSDKWENVANNVERGKQVFKDSAIGEGLRNPTIKGIEVVNSLTGGKLQDIVDNLDDSVKGSVLENLRRFNYHLLGEVEDNPFVKTNFVNRLASYMKAQGINDIDSVSNDAIQTAYQEALKATFKDDNFMTKAFTGIKKSTGKFGEVMLPFVKTPANIAKRGIDYSPVGFIETLMNLNGRQFADVMDDLSKNIVGTAAIALGYTLAEKGLIQGALSDNKNEKQFEKQQGKQAFSINLGDKYYTFDWAQPASIPLIIGATIHDAVKESDEENANYLDIAKQGTIAAVDAWANTSPISSLQEILGGGEYASDSVGENILNSVTNFPQRVIPSLSSAIAKTSDPVYRETYEKNNPLSTYVNVIKSKIPGLSKTLPVSYDTWGQERRRQETTGDAIVANFLNPGTFGYNSSTPIDNEIQRLGETSVSAFPRKAENAIGDRTLTVKERSDYQREMGRHSYELAEKFLNSDIYRQLDDAERTNLLSKLYSASKAVAENDLFGKEYPSTYKTYAEIYKNEGADALIEHITKSEKFSDRDLSTASSKNQRIYDAKSDEGLNVLSEIKKKYDTVSTKNAYKYFESQGNIPTLEAGEYLYMLDETAKGHSKGVQNAYDKGGYSAVYDYYTIKNNADTNGNGSLTKGEIQEYLASFGMDEPHINAWLEVFGK